MIRENERKVPSGYLMLVVIFVLQLPTFYWAMVGNLLTVLCSEEGAQPVLNTGSLYS